MRSLSLFSFVLLVLLLPVKILAAEGEAPAPEAEAPPQEAKDDAATKPEAEAEAEKPEAAEAPSVVQKASYGIGVGIATDFKRRGINVDLKYLLMGLEDALTNRKPRVSQEEVQKALEDYQKQLVENFEKRQTEVASRNQREAETFLAENAKRDGVQTAEGGLQYTVLREGEGTPPKPDDTVKVHYKGMLLDGTVFDSSYQRGEPTQFRIDQVIQGWQDALTLMKPGAKWKLWIPPALAYGQEGRPPRIPPNAVLVFEVELIKVDDTVLKTPDAP